jgi:hypothetical protein
MTLADFVAKVASGEIRVPIGGRDKEGRMVSGFADASTLTSQQIAAEAFSNEVDEASTFDFDRMVSEVTNIRGSDGGAV